MRQIKATTTDYLFQSTLFLISTLCCTLLLLFRRETRRSFLWILGRCRHFHRKKKLILMNWIRLLWAQISRDSFIPSGIVWQFKAFWFTVRVKAVGAWVGIPKRESHDQTVRVGRSVLILRRRWQQWMKLTAIKQRYQMNLFFVIFASLFYCRTRWLTLIHRRV